MGPITQQHTSFIKFGFPEGDRPLKRSARRQTRPQSEPAAIFKKDGRRACQLIYGRKTPVIPPRRAKAWTITRRFLRRKSNTVPTQSPTVPAGTPIHRLFYMLRRRKSRQIARNT